MWLVDRSRRFVPIGIPVALAVIVVLVAAWHWSRLGWRDRHVNYISRPSGYTQIVNRFGQPCSAAASAISMPWTASDTGQTYTFRFHRKLGGYPTEMVSDKGGSSTNLDNDVFGHIQNDHLQPYVEHGIYGYFCRAKRNSSEWSTHAFGIAIDVSSAEEYMGKCSFDREQQARVDLATARVVLGPRVL